MSSRFQNSFFTSLYAKHNRLRTGQDKPDEDIETVDQQIDEDYQEAPEEPQNVPFEQEVPTPVDERSEQDPSYQLQRMLLEEPEDRDLPPIEDSRPEDTEGVSVKRDPQMDEEELSLFPKGKSGFQIKIDYAISKQRPVNVRYVGEYQKNGPNYSILPVEWGLSEKGRFVWAQDLNDPSTAIKMFYMHGFDSVEF